MYTSEIEMMARDHQRFEEVSSHYPDYTNEGNEHPEPTEVISLLPATGDTLLPQEPSTDLPRYAEKGILARFIPNAGTTDPSFRMLLSRRATMLRIQLSLALITTILNIAFTAWAYTTDVPENGVGTLYSGDCVWTARLNSGAHIFLNVFASLFLGAGNYCMQILVAPSLREVTAAHSKGRSFDIGTQSIRNLLQIRRSSKKLLWLGIGICSTLLHLM